MNEAVRQTRMQSWGSDAQLRGATSLGRTLQATDLNVAVFRTLQVAAALCFIGHGAFGFITKADWIPFFAVVGIPADWAWKLQPVIGTVDVLLGFALLVRPTKAFLLYMSVWCVWTASLRPLDGRGMWEFFERAGNYGVPFALLLIGFAVYPGNRGWFRKLEPPEQAPELVDRLIGVLKLTVAALLVGHAGFAVLMEKPVLLEHLATVGLGDGTVASLPFLYAQGFIEIALALAVLVVPKRHVMSLSVVLLTVFVWKLATELLYPLSGDYIFEFIERAGSYGAPLALLALLWLRYGQREGKRFQKHS